MQHWVYSGNRYHPTEKTVELITPLIKSFSSPGDLMINPFLNSGTIADADVSSRRFYIDVELEQRCCNLAVNRMAGFSGGA